MNRYNPPDDFLPESYTCFFLLKMPRYSGKAVLRFDHPVHKSFSKFKIFGENGIVIIRRKRF